MEYSEKKQDKLINTKKKKLMITELWEYRDLLKLLVSKTIKLKYRRSFLGYVWSVLNPLLIMIVMSIVFSKMFSRNITNYPLYLFCGQLLFNFMNHSTHQAISSVSASGSLLKKTHVPKHIFTISKITGGLVDLAFSLGALIIVIIATQAQITWYALLFPFVLIPLYLFCVGLGLFLAQANVFFRDIQYIYNAITTAWLYMTPLFYTIEILPKKVAWFITHFNPMYFYISQFRDIIYIGQAPEAKYVIAGWVVALLSLLIGSLLFRKNEDKFILYV